MSTSKCGFLESKEAKYFGFMLDYETTKKITNDPKLDISSPFNSQYIAQNFTGDRFHQTLLRYQTEDGIENVQDGDKHAVYLCANCMQHGVKIGKDDMEMIRSILLRVQMFEKQSDRWRKV